MLHELQILVLHFVTSLLVLQIVVSVLFLLNKVFLAAGEKTGWLWGAIGCLLAVCYFYRLHLLVYMVLDIGMVVLMTYGYLKKGAKRPLVELTIQIVSAIVMVVMAYSAFMGVLTLIELASAIGILIGTYVLTHGKVRAGWILYAVANTLTVVVAFKKHQHIFADFQIAQVVVALYVLFREQRNRNPLK